MPPTKTSTKPQSTKATAADVAALEGVLDEIRRAEQHQESLMAKRDRLIRRLAAGGMSTRALGKIVDVTHQGIAWILNRPAR